MRKVLWSALTLAAAITLVIGCSKQLPTQLSTPGKSASSNAGEGINCQLSIGDFVWNDLNGNGVQDPGEPGIEGVAVVLLASNGDFIAEEVTDQNGFYAFRDVCEGKYKVYVKEPNCPATKLGGTADPNKDSNPNPTELDLGETDYSVDFGFVCNPKEECKPCQGKLTDLCLKYTGGVGGNVFVGKSAKTYAFKGFVEPGGVFCFKGWDKDGTFGKSIKVLLNGKEVAKFVGECKSKKTIAVGTTGGPFVVVSGDSKDGGPLCERDVPPTGDDLCTVKPHGLRIVYTGEDCSASSNIQAAGKTGCSGDPAGASPVHIVVTNSATEGSGKIYFDGVVNVGEEFTMDAANAGDTKLSAQTYAYIYSNGALVQKLTFHTSCSQPLRRDDQFGSLKVVGVASGNFQGTNYSDF